MRKFEPFDTGCRLQLPRSMCERIDRRTPGGIRRGGRVSAGKKKDPLLYGITSFSAAAFYQSAIGGGEPGIASGFGAIALVRWHEIPTGSQMVAQRVNGSATAGWYIQTSGAAVRAICVSGAGSPVISATYTLAPSDVGRVMLVEACLDGAGMLWLGVNGVIAGAGVAITGYTPAESQPMRFGIWETTQGFVSGCLLSFAAWRGTLSVAQRRAYADAARMLGDLPSTMQGATITHRVSVRDQLRGQAIPSRRYGARAFASGAYFTVPATAMPGSLSGFNIRLRLRHDSTPATNSTLLENADGAKGLSFYYTSGSLRVYNYATGTDVASYSISSADYAVAPNVYTIAFTGTTWRLYKGDTLIVENAGSYVVPSAQGAIGIYLHTLINAASAFSMFEVAYSLGVPAVPELTAMIASGTLVIPDKTDHRWLLGDSLGVPASAQDLVGTEHLPRVGTLELAVHTPTAPAAPATLEDTITRAAPDAFARQGSPTVVTIDPSRDGRRTLGVLSTGTTASYLQTSGTAFRGSLDKFWFSYWWTPTAASTSAQRQLLTHTGAAQGLILYTDAGTNGALGVWNLKSNSAPLGTYARSAADVGQPMLVTVCYDNGAWSGYVNGALWATGNAVYAVSSGPVRIFVNAGFSSPAEHASWWGLAGSDSHAITAAEALQHYQDVTRTGRMQGIAGKTEHVIDPTTDILAAGETVPAQILDRIGTDHLMRVDFQIVTATAAGKTMRGVKGWATGVNRYSAPSASVFPGDSAGFWIAAIATPTDATLAAIVSNQQNTAGVPGVSLVLESGLWRAYGWNGSANVALAYAAYTLGAPQHAIFQCTGTGWQIYVDRNVLGAGQTTMPYVAPATQALLIGDSTTKAAKADQPIFGVVCGLGVLTQAERESLYDQWQSSGEIGSVLGKTTRRYPITSLTAGKTAGDAPPLVLVDSVGVGGDLIRAGAGLQVAQRTERTWSYETSPVTKVGTISAGNRWESDSATPLGESAAAGIIIGAVVRLKGTTSGRIIAHANGGLQGWNLSSSAGSVLSWGFVDGTTAKLLPNIVVSADSKFRAIMLHIEATQARAFHNRAQVGSATAIATGYTSAEGLLGLAIGSWVGGSALTPDVEVLGVYIGQGSLALAQEQAWEDACLAQDTIVPVPGALGQHLWRFDRTSGLTLLDQIGSLHIPAIGSPVITDVYSRAWAR